MRGPFARNCPPNARGGHDAAHPPAVGGMIEPPRRTPYAPGVRRAVLAVIGAALAAALGGGIGARLAPKDIDVVGGPPRIVVGGPHAAAG